MIPKLPGFSLIEMAIVLIIIGLVGGLTLPTLKVMIDWQKNSVTVQNQEKILYALASYAVRHKILPYAADPKNPVGKQDKARRRGIVPYADLGLPESMARDGYHRWFTYVVDDYYGKHKIGPMTLGSQLCDHTPHPHSLNIKGVQDNIALALISHGPGGRGAFPPAGSPPQGGDEMQNSTSETEIIDRPMSQDSSNPFSHKVAWVTAKNLLAMYGHAPCPPIDDAPRPHTNLYQPPENPKK